jgi:hypothetical protein
MSRYLDDHNNLPVDERTGLPLENTPDDDDDEEIIVGERKVSSAWNVIGAGIVIVLIASAGVAMWPRQTTTDPTPTASTTPVAPTTAEPSGSTVPPKAVETTGAGGGQ